MKIHFKKTLLLCACLVIFICQTVNAQTGLNPWEELIPWDGTVATEFYSGSGTQNDPYLIYTPQEMAYLAWIINSGTEPNTPITVKYYLLGADIDLAGLPWTPIGLFNKGFNENFNGGGFTIFNLKVSIDNKNTNDGAGLFGSANGESVINNIIMDATCSVKSHKRAGGIVGRSQGKIINCINYGSVTTTENDAGGIVGFYPSNKSIENCKNYGKIKGVNFVGGIAGPASGGTITGCSNYGNVIGEGTVGGIVGQSGCYIKKCFNRGTIDSKRGNVGGIVGSSTSKGISLCYNDGNVISINGYYTGGIVGMIERSSAPQIIKKCFNAGKITGYGYVGGIAGLNDIATVKPIASTIENCYNQGRIIVEKEKSNYAGGIVGLNGGIMNNVYNTGTIVCPYGTYVGEIVGFNDPLAIVNNAFYDSQFASVNVDFGNIKSSKGGKLTSEMMSFQLQDIFGHDNGIWVYQDNFYPRLDSLESSNTAIAYAAAIRLNAKQTIQNVSSDFLVQNLGGINWGSDREDIVSIGNGYGVVTPKDNPANVTVSATLGDATKMVHFSVIPSQNPSFNITLKVNGNGKIVRGNDFIENLGTVKVESGSRTSFYLIPNSDNYLVSAKYNNVEQMNTNMLTAEFDNGYLRLGLLPVTSDGSLEITFAEVNEWEGDVATPLVSADGTKYMIYRPEELRWLAEQVNSGNDMTGKSFKLINTICLGGHNHMKKADPFIWEPIGGGKYGETKVFNGSFDGNGKLINNYWIGPLPNNLSPDLMYDNVGLFGILGPQGSIKQLGVVGESTVNGKNNVGGLVGSNYGSIQFCHNTGIVNYFMSGGNVGGLVGKNNSSGTIFTALAIGGVDQGAPEFVAGSIGAIVGFNENSQYDAIENCFYDNQICLSVGIIKGVGNQDDGGSINGYLTKYLTSGIPFPEIENVNFVVFEEGLYPKLKGSEHENAAIVSALPIGFIDKENIDNVKSAFSLGYYKGFKWTSSNPEIVDVSDLSSNAIVKRPLNEDAKVSLYVTSPDEKYYNIYNLTVKAVKEGSFNLNIAITDGGVIRTGSGQIINTTTPVNLTIPTEGGMLLGITPNNGYYLSKVEKSYDDGTITDVTDEVFIYYIKGYLLYQTEDMTQNMSLKFTFSPINVWSENSEIQKPFSDGYNYYLIYRPEELAWIAHETVLGNHFYNCGFKLLNDIDLGINQNWNPIGGGYGGKNRLFNGQFDGMNKTINNLYINLPDVSYIGLFGAIGSNGTVSSLNINNVNVTGKDYTGSFIGYLFGADKGIISDIDNCNVLSGNVTGGNFVGGVVGYIKYNSNTINCVNKANITGNGVKGFTGGISGFNDGVISWCDNYGNITNNLDYIGGITGYNNGGENESKIISSRNYGNIYGTGNNIGGISGFNDGTVNAFCLIEFCSNSGKISGKRYVGGIVGNNINGAVNKCYNTGEVLADMFGGGISGHNDVQSISYCFNSGAITGQRYMGGIVGQNNNNGMIAYCYNTGYLKSTSEDGISGGIVGLGMGRVANSYNAGTLEGSRNIGALVGMKMNGMTLDCYHDIQMSTSTGINGVTAGNIKGLTTQQLISSGFEFKKESAAAPAAPINPWHYEEGYYPQLSAFRNISSTQTSDPEEVIRASQLSVVPIMLNSDDSYSDIKNESFSINLHSNQSALSDNTNVIQISGTNASVTRPDSDNTKVLVTITDGYNSKIIPLTVLQSEGSQNTFTKDGDWNNSANWSLGKVPSATENIIINANAILNSIDASCKDISINPTGSLTINGGSSLIVSRFINALDPAKLILNNSHEANASLTVQNHNYPPPFITVNQEITTGNTAELYNWQLISIPVNDIKGNEVVDVFRGALLDRYDEETAQWQRYGNHIGFPVGSTVERFKGYSLNFTNIPHNLIFKGQMFNNDAVFTLMYHELLFNQGSNTVDYGGLNLIGNPYLNSLDISKFGTYAFDDSFDKSVWIWNSQNGNYEVQTFNGASNDITDGIIPACQAFWVRLNPVAEITDPLAEIPVSKSESNLNIENKTNNGTILLPHTATVTTDKKPIKSAPKFTSLKFKVVGTKFGDEVVIAEVPETTTDFDNGWDGRKWAGRAEAPQMYAIEGDLKLSLDVKPDISETWLGFEAGNSSNYILSLSASGDQKDVILTDLKTGTIHNFSENISYSFSAEKGEDAKRFKITSKNMDDIGSVNDDNIGIYSFGSIITITGASGTTVQISDMSGKIISEFAGNDIIKKDISKNGVYIVRVIGNNFIKSEKVIIGK